MAGILEQVAIGFDQAKETIYNYMKKYYPKIEDSQSTLTNALVSGIAYIYSMFQVFAKLLQDEHYVATAREIESLYKLMPFVGIDLSQPSTMKIEGDMTAQDESITVEGDPELYLITDGSAWLDQNGYNFHLRVKSYVNKRFFSYNQSWLVTSTGKRLTLSIGKLLGSDFFPASFYSGDSFKVSFLYKDDDLNSVKLGVLTFDKTGTITTTGSDAPADLDTTLANPTVCAFNNMTGLLELQLLGNMTFDDSELEGQYVDITFTSRSVYLKQVISTNIALFVAYAPTSFSAYDKNNIYNNASLPVDPASIVQFQAKTLGTVANVLSLTMNRSIDPDSFVLRHNTEGDLQFDFSQAEIVTDVFWGDIYKLTLRWTGDNNNPTELPYYAYILDKDVGILVFDDPEALDELLTADLGSWTADFTRKPNSKALIDQYESKVLNIVPPSEFDLNTNTYILEDVDPILFSELNFRILDVGYETTIFTQVDNVNNYEGSPVQAYFEVTPQDSTKIKIKFGTEIDYSTIANLEALYNVVKELDNYQAGETISGSAVLRDADDVTHTSGGTSIFNFDAVNKTGEAGVGGIPDIETLRDTLEKASYTLDLIVTALNYESAIQSWYISQGYTALIKVFGYEDFGLTFLDSINGNIVFFCGLVNKAPNSNLVLVVPFELPSTYTGGGFHDGEYTRALLDADIPQPLTDLDANVSRLITRIGEDTDDIDDIQEALRPDMVLTNYLLSQEEFVLAYGVYFKVQIRPNDGYSFEEASNAFKIQIASYFKWSTMQFVRDLAVSDVYRDCDSLPEINKLFFTNFSHYHNDGTTGDIKVHDITYQKKQSVISLGPMGLKFTASAGGTTFVSRTLSAGSVTAVAGANPAGNKLTGVNWVNENFYAGMKVTITGFTNPANNGTNITIISAGVADLVLDDSEITLVNEGPVNIIVEETDTNFEENGNLAEGRLIDIDTGTPVVNAEILTLSENWFIMRDIPAPVSGTHQSVTITDQSERMEHPLWDFAEADTTRELRIDVLMLGGIETEVY